MQYVIQLKNKRYLTYQGTKQAVIYGHYDPRLSYDLAITNGKLVPMEGDMFETIFKSDEYSNVLPSEEEEFSELRDAFREMISSKEGVDETIYF